MGKKIHTYAFLHGLLSLLVIISLFCIIGCKKDVTWKLGKPFQKTKIKIGVIFSSGSGDDSLYDKAHYNGLKEMQKNLGLADSQIILKFDVFYGDAAAAEGAMRDCIAEGANVIIATTWGYMDTCEKLAAEFPSVVFAHASGTKYNNTNFTNYFGRVYQARYLSGIVAGAQTKTGKIGYVAAMGKENSEVTGGINAFALGAEKINPEAKIYVKVTYSWIDPIEETLAAKELIAAGCDVIAQHCDTTVPQVEAEKAGVWGIGYNSDTSAGYSSTLLTSVMWRWGVYYTSLIKSIITGSYTSNPWLGSLKNGIVDISPLNKDLLWETDALTMLDNERERIKSGESDVFYGVMKTNDGRVVGETGKNMPDDLILSGIDWYYVNVIELKNNE
ncbi:MAG: BMP family ABC transporter substrate-binding protein [Deferribacteraceae bacterium]|jgi:basic membrane protein A|nr:BMP family ABC transporter substrate-binding protein [Deferribacteraceae bacterium]